LGNQRDQALSLKLENSSGEEDRKDPKLTWHVPEVIYITDSEEEAETESYRSQERSQEVIVISSDEESHEDEINDIPEESWEEESQSSGSGSESEGFVGIGVE